ncbi:hypothetical protein DPMN_168570 [Dreissena polymorpha]|uniref:Uncharacterized protein n=1 Tax=Dreissena polymorpha TaxID=45954 RepID=A0A9D4IW17_DREPO|nr:hypothetical protein DPMN_168570 [Dreissena polymorpha]
MEDLPHDSSTFKGQHYITRTNFKLEDLANEFVDSLIDNIKARYSPTCPSDRLVIATNSQ